MLVKGLQLPDEKDEEAMFESISLKMRATESVRKVLFIDDWQYIASYIPKDSLYDTKEEILLKLIRMPNLYVVVCSDTPIRCVDQVFTVELKPLAPLLDEPLRDPTWCDIVKIFVYTSGRFMTDEEAGLFYRIIQTGLAPDYEPLDAKYFYPKLLCNLAKKFFEASLISGGDNRLTEANAHKLSAVAHEVHESYMAERGRLLHFVLTNTPTNSERALTAADSNTNRIIEGVTVNSDGCPVFFGRSNHVYSSTANSGDAIGYAPEQLLYCGRKMNACRCGGMCYVEARDGQCGPYGCPCNACMITFKHLLPTSSTSPSSRSSIISPAPILTPMEDYDDGLKAYMQLSNNFVDAVAATEVYM